MCIQRTPQPARAPAGQDARRARRPGCLSLVTFFAQAKKVTRSSAGGVEALYLLSQEDPKQRKGRSKELDSSFRWNDPLRKRRAKTLDSGFRRNDEPRQELDPSFRWDDERAKRRTRSSIETGNG